MAVKTLAFNVEALKVRIIDEGLFYINSKSSQLLRVLYALKYLEY